MIGVSRPTEHGPEPDLSSPAISQSAWHFLQARQTAPTTTGTFISTGSSVHRCAPCDEQCVPRNVSAQLREGLVIISHDAEAGVRMREGSLFSEIIIGACNRRTTMSADRVCKFSLYAVIPKENTTSCCSTESGFG